MAPGATVLVDDFPLILGAFKSPWRGYRGPRKAISVKSEPPLLRKEQALLFGDL
jgi:hypothetical protein